MNSYALGKWGSLEVWKWGSGEVWKSGSLEVGKSGSRKSKVESRKSEEDRVVAMSGGGFSGAERSASTRAKGSFNGREATIQLERWKSEGRKVNRWGGWDGGSCALFIDEPVVAGSSHHLIAPTRSFYDF